MYSVKNIHILVVLLFILSIFPALSFAFQVIYVMPEGAGDGSSWADAAGNLQSAIDNASYGDWIWVAAGMYPASDSFYMKSGVSVFGGFDGTETYLSERDWQTNETTLLPLEPFRSDHIIYNQNVDSDSLLDGFFIEGGWADGTGEHACGGGIYNSNSHLTIRNCTFSTNSATGYGGAIQCSNASCPTIMNCKFIGNKAGVSGGAIRCYSGSNAVIINCAFWGNIAYEGGGLFCSDSSPTVINCLFSGNEATHNGGALYCYNGSQPEITNCTIAYNSAVSACGGLANLNSSPTVSNCIIWGNSAVYFPQVVNENSIPVMSYCDIQGSIGSGPSWNTLIGNDAGGNIDMNPQFTDADGTDGTYGTEDDDLSLPSGSPCIDSGDNSVITYESDFEGKPRILNGNGESGTIVDMGAYEYQPPIIYVKQNAAGANNGTNWINAYISLQDALTEVDSTAISYQIWVAEGTYKPTSDYGTGDGSDRYNHFRLQNGVSLYGGFPNMGDPGWNDRDPESFITILSGDLADDDDPNTSVDNLLAAMERANNCYHVFYHPDGLGLDATAILDGFTVSGGQADGTGHGNGGGIYNYNNSPTLINCIFRNNAAQLDGGGVGNNHYSSPSITDCRFENNRAGDDGGGMYNWRSSSPYVLRCRFQGNAADKYGGGMYNYYYADPTVDACVFVQNEAEYGGGMRNYEGSAAEVSNSIFRDNTALIDGGGLHDYESGCLVTQCTIVNNSAGYGGGGLRCEYGDPTIANSIVWGNTSLWNPQIQVGYESSLTVVYCDIEGDFIGTGNLDADPLFADADLNLKSYSPCINRGTPSGVYTGLTDWNGDPRIAYNRIDIGADEVFPVAGDFEPDEDVDLADLATFMAEWLSLCSAGNGWCGEADIDHSTRVDLTDLACITRHWLYEPTL